MDFSSELEWIGRKDDFLRMLTAQITEGSDAYAIVSRPSTGGASTYSMGTLGDMDTGDLLMLHRMAGKFIDNSIDGSASEFD